MRWDKSVRSLMINRDIFLSGLTNVDILLNLVQKLLFIKTIQ